MFLDIPEIEYFQAKNKYSGNVKNFNYKIIPEDELVVYVWDGTDCFDCTETKQSMQFSFDSNGYQAMLQWIEDCRIQIIQK